MASDIQYTNPIFAERDAYMDALKKAEDAGDKRAIDWLKGELKNRIYPNIDAIGTRKQKIADAWNVPAFQVTDESPSLYSRFKMGFGGNEEEKRAFAGLPEGTEFREVDQGFASKPLMTYKTPDNVIGVLNPKGFEAGDVAQSLSEYGPETVAGTVAGVLQPNKFIVPGLATAGGRAFKEGLQSAFEYPGPQMESPEQIGMGLGGEFLLGGAGNKFLGPAIQKAAESITNVATGRGLMTADPNLPREGQLRYDLGDFYGALDELPQSVRETAPPFTADQLSRGKGMKSWAAQTIPFTPAYVDRNTAQQGFGVTMARSAQLGGKAPARTAEEALEQVQTQRALTGSELDRGVIDTLEAKRGGAVRRATGPEQTRTEIGTLGEALRQDYLSAGKTAKQKAFKAVDYYAEKENPVWSFDNTLDAFKRMAVEGDAGTEEIVSSLVDASGKPISLGQIQLKLDVLPPHGQLAVVSGMLKRLDSTQTDYAVIKELRSRVGNILEDVAGSSNPQMMDSYLGKVKQIYGAMSKDMMNPLVVDDTTGQLVPGAPNTKNAIIAANRITKEYYDDITTRGFMTMTQNMREPEALAKQFAQNPELFSPDFRAALKRYPSNKVKDFYTLIQQDILTSTQGAESALDAFKKNAGRAFEEIVPNERLLREAAKHVDKYRAQLRQLEAPLNKSVDSASRVLNQFAQTREESAQLVRELSYKNRQFLKLAAMDEILRPAVKTNEKGVYLDPAAMQKAYAEAAEKGWMSTIFDSADVKRLKGIMAFLRITQRKGDVGATLEAAQAFTQLKHPTTMLAGLHKITVNRAIGMMMLSPRQSATWRKLMLGNMKDSSSLPKLRAAGVGGIEALNYWLELTHAPKKAASEGYQVGKKVAGAVKRDFDAYIAEPLEE